MCPHLCENSNQFTTFIDSNLAFNYFQKGQKYTLSALMHVNVVNVIAADSV